MRALGAGNISGEGKLLPQVSKTKQSNNWTGRKTGSAVATTRQQQAGESFKEAKFHPARHKDTPIFGTDVVGDERNLGGGRIRLPDSNGPTEDFCKNGGAFSTRCSRTGRTLARPQRPWLPWWTPCQTACPGEPPPVKEALARLEQVRSRDHKAPDSMGADCSSGASYAHKTADQRRFLGAFDVRCVSAARRGDKSSQERSSGTYSTASSFFA